MSLRKLLTSFHFQRGTVPESTSLRDWLLGAGVAAACLTPIGAASSLSGGIVPVGCQWFAERFVHERQPDKCATILIIVGLR